MNGEKNRTSLTVRLSGNSDRGKEFRSTRQSAKASYEGSFTAMISHVERLFGHFGTVVPKNEEK